MVFQFGTAEITPILEEIRDCIDTIDIGIERKARKQEDIFIPNKPCVEDIEDCLGGGVDLTSFCFVDMDRFPKFDMVITAPPQLTM